MSEFLVIVGIGSVLLAAVVWIVIYRAVGTVFDWLILTFGNAEAVERLKRQKGWGSSEDSTQ